MKRNEVMVQQARIDVDLSGFVTVIRGLWCQ